MNTQPALFDFATCPLAPTASEPSGYPADWPVIALRLKNVFGWRCEHCDHVHDVAAGYMLGVHHLDMNKQNCRWLNLVVLCQRCHLRIQATYKPGQAFLLGRPRWAIIRGL